MQVGSLGVGGVGGVAVGLIGGDGTWHDAVAKAFHASTLRRSSALNRLGRRTMVAVTIMAGCCERHKASLLSASCAVYAGLQTTPSQGPRLLFLCRRFG